MIKLVRCDDRLIHGQCVTKIVPVYGIKAIICVDDPTASNPMLKKIFTMASPPGVKTTPVTFQDALPMIREALTDDVPTLVIFRVPDLMEKLLAEIPELPHDLNVACVPLVAKLGGTEIYPGIYFTDEQLASVKRMGESGVHIWLQKTPESTLLEWDSIKHKY